MPKTHAEAATEPHATVPLSTLRWWRELVDLNPADLAPRLDAQIERLEQSK
ncbi:hypothetical protein RIdsm_03636 [Roseovarius indicus]|uniref:Uncharacterized protein n=1 Tax=Roseovarius indicus TaxID=540747 RepID=A0A5P3AGA9_9RHOB|nr:hypothetical protein RIdsm_03636 [Roseovarius indicus]SFE79994.1 hypothetical protein SAMN04488031_12252 [Roseovarius indicus]